VLVSELLLQKTDAPKVEALFNDFFLKYPTIHDLYRAKITELEKILQPLGLYKKRSLRLKSIAHEVVEEYSGKIPSDREKLLELNGVGDYIANAVICFAFRKSMPIVDTNVIRIFERLLNVHSLKKRPRTDKEIWIIAKKMLPKKNFQDYNYSLLDFASVICKDRKPDCQNCMFLKNCNFGGKYIYD